MPRGYSITPSSSCIQLPNLSAYVSACFCDTMPARISPGVLPSVRLGDVASAVSLAERKVSIPPVGRQIDRSIILCFLPKLRAPPSSPLASHCEFALLVYLCSAHRGRIARALCLPRTRSNLRDVGSIDCEERFVFTSASPLGKQRGVVLSSPAVVLVRAVCISRAFCPTSCRLCVFCLLQRPEFIRFRALCAA